MLIIFESTTYNQFNMAYTIPTNDKNSSSRKYRKTLHLQSVGIVTVKFMGVCQYWDNILNAPSDKDIMGHCSNYPNDIPRSYGFQLNDNEILPLLLSTVHRKMIIFLMSNFSRIIFFITVECKQ